MTALPYLYKEIISSANKVLAANGIDAVRASKMAEEVAESFCRANSEQVLRVPNLKQIRKKRRDEQIRKDSQTLSAVKVAKKHGISVRMVYSALAEKVGA